jgi:hypothetical protein
VRHVRRGSLLSCDWHILVAIQPCSSLLVILAGNHRAMNLHLMRWCVSLLAGWWCGFPRPFDRSCVAVPTSRAPHHLDCFPPFSPAGAALLTQFFHLHCYFPPALLLHSILLSSCAISHIQSLLVQLNIASTCTSFSSRALSHIQSLLVRLPNASTASTRTSFSSQPISNIQSLLVRLDNASTCLPQP